MSFLDRFRSHSRNTARKDLLGCWHLVYTENQPAENTEIEFHSNGDLTYAIDAGDRWQVMRLRYRIEGDYIISDQPSAPREERTRFRIEDDGTLVLDYGATASHYRRGARRAPNL